MPDSMYWILNQIVPSLKFSLIKTFKNVQPEIYKLVRHIDKLSTYHAWFCSGDVLQNEFG